MKLEDLQKIPNTAQPTPGLGLVLDHNGRLPQGVLQTLPGYEFSYVEFTGNVSVTATTEATANTVVTAGAVTFDGATACWVEFFSMQVVKGTSYINIFLYDGAGSIGNMAQTVTTGGQMLAQRKLTPSAAAHTFSIRSSVDAGTGTVVAGAGGNAALMPGYIRITRA